MESETRNPFLSEVLSAESSFFKNVPEIGQFSPPPASFSTSTCGTSVSTNTTYIRNPTYPSRYKPSSASTCSFTINKVSDDICQLRLDFQTFSGFVIDATSAVCTDSFAVAGQTGKNPPTICGTNTGYHSG